MSKESFGKSNKKLHDTVIVNGGGQAAFANAIAIAEEAQKAGKKIDIVMIADKFSTPVPVGNHLCPESDGMFEGEFSDHSAYSAEYQQSMVDGLNYLIDVVKKYNIDCRMALGYEVKGNNLAEFEEGVQDMIDRGVYKAEDIIRNDGDQKLKMDGYPYSVFINGTIGQINLMDMIKGLSKVVTEHFGVDVRMDTKYQDSKQLPNGQWVTYTDKGELYSTKEPILAHGAYALKNNPAISKHTEIRYTLAFTSDEPLPADVWQKISGGKPQAIGDTNMADVRWGGIDPKGYFTFGRGDLDAPANGNEKDPEFIGQVKALEQEIRDEIRTTFPGVDADKLRMTVGPMLMTDNQLPVVLRTNKGIIMGSWSGTGIASAWGAALDVAKFIVHGDESGMDKYTKMHPEIMAELERPAPAPANKSAEQKIRATGSTLK